MRSSSASLADASCSASLQRDFLVTWSVGERRPRIRTVDSTWIPIASDNAEVRCLWREGSIVNRRDLIDSHSEDDGVLFSSLLSRHGPDEAVGRVAGPFSCLIWEERRRRLVLVADRFGLSTLYLRPGRDLFLSNRLEPALTDAPTRQPDELSIANHLHGLNPPPGATFYVGARRLRPGEILTATSPSPKVWTYWSPRAATSRRRSEGEWATELRELLFKIVAQYCDDSQIGIALSGGMDSTSVAASVRRAAPQTRLEAFSWVSPDLPEADESERIDEVCSFLALSARKIRADRFWTLRAEATIQTASAGPWRHFFEEAWAETFRQMSQAGIRSALMGAGGDELFGSFNSLPDLWVTGKWLRLRKELLQLPRSGPKSAMRRAASATAGQFVKAYSPSWIWRRSPPWIAGAVRRQLRQQAPLFEHVRFCLPGRALRLRGLQNSRYSPILPGLGQLAKQHGIMLLCPLLDHRLIEFAMSLRTDQIYREGRGKVVLREAMRGLLPDSVLDQRDKTRPTEIFRRGFQRREQAKIWPLLERMRCAEMGLVKEAVARDHYRQYVQGRRDWEGYFWPLVGLEDWLRRYF